MKKEDSLFFIVAGVVVILDQLVKWYIRNTFSLGETKVWLFTYIQNTGAGFGILKNNSILLGWVSVIAIGIILYLFATLDASGGKMKFPLALILGGTIGNAIDRFSLNYVVDFIDFKVWPAFNVADSAIVIGGLLLVLILSRKK